MIGTAEQLEKLVHTQEVIDAIAAEVKFGLRRL